MTADLIARMESADAGSRDLDAEVAMALGWTRGEFGNWWTTYPNGQSVNRKTEPPLTTDLTTIVAEIELRLPGWEIGLDKLSLEHRPGRAGISDPGIIAIPQFTGAAATMTLAAGACLLRADARETGEAG